MPHYAKYTTTVIGAYSVPRWYEPLDRLVTMGQLLPEDMADAQHRVMQAAVLEQGDLDQAGCVVRTADIGSVSRNFGARRAQSLFGLP